MSNTYNNFKSFFRENKNKIFMKHDVNYPLNYIKGKEWADSQCDQDSRMFANDIIRHTKYVSYGEFISALQSVASSYMKSIGKKKSNDMLILIIPFAINKSNTWVTMLVFDIIKDIVDDVYPSVTAAYNDSLDKSSKLFGKKIKCIICDDCIYTGNQITEIIQLDNMNINSDITKNQPPATDVRWLDWYDKTKDQAINMMNGINIDEFSVDLVVPFMSTISKQRVLDIPYVRIPRVCVVFPIFRQQINVGDIKTPILNEFRKTFQYHEDISAIYFDHKIADAVSTFHKVYMLGPLFNCVIDNISMNFIENCKLNRVPDNLNIYDFYIDIADTGTEICPDVFYKSIDYTMNGKSIDTSLSLMDAITLK